MSENIIEKSFDRILISKNWNNILLRNDVRVEMWTAREKFDERRLVEYLGQMNDEQLGDVRWRVFKLARDHYFESVLRKHASNRPFLKEAGHYNRFEVIRDVVECVEFIINARERLPARCTEFSGPPTNSGFDFPLGRKNLLVQLNAVKTLRFKILKLQTELHNFRRLTNGMEKMENSLSVSNDRLRQLQKQNEFLKSLLTFFLVICITCSVSFLFFNCLTKDR